MKFQHNTQAEIVKIPLLRKWLGVVKVDIGIQCKQVEPWGRWVADSLGDKITHNY